MSDWAGLVHYHYPLQVYVNTGRRAFPACQWGKAFIEGKCAVQVTGEPVTCLACLHIVEERRREWRWSQELITVVIDGY